MTEPERVACLNDPRFMREQNLCLFALSKMRMGGEGFGEGMPEQELAGILEGVEFVCECRG
jgi:hypothetical protein